MSAPRFAGMTRRQIKAVVNAEHAQRAARSQAEAEAAAARERARARAAEACDVSAGFDTRKATKPGDRS